MPRRNDAKNNKYYSSTGYPPSPPAHLPTPLPDERPPVNSALYASSMEDSDILSPLIDFDTPPPPQPMVLLPADTGSMSGSDLDDDVASSRSPPFREARFPQDSPPPLPIRPRAFRWPIDGHPDHRGSVEDPIVVDDRSFVGHSRTPTFSRPGTRTTSTHVSPIFPTSSTLENLSRTIRGYVPSTISSAASPPLNSYGVRIGPGTHSGPPSHSRTASQQEYERGDELNDEEDNGHANTQYHHITSDRRRAATHSADVEFSSSARQFSVPMGSSGLAQAMHRNIHTLSKPPTDQAEAIRWARWDFLYERLLLFVGYACGLQVWDCTNLSSVDEVLNLNLDSAEWRLLLEGEGSGTSVRVVHAAVLPSPSNGHHGDIDPFMAQRPLIGILVEFATEQTIFFLYSLQHRHRVVKRLGLPGAPSTFVSNEHFTVISTTNPPILHILSSTTFQTLHQITSPSLELFIPQVSFISQAMANVHSNSTNLGSALQDQDTPNPPSSPKPLTPSPIFSLSHRLLAYASSSPSTMSSISQESLNSKDTRRFSSSSNTSAPSGPESSASSSPFGFGPPSIGQITAITRADVGHAALKVGESMFTGMKHLGGMALEAAKNRVVSGQSFGVGIASQRPSSGSGRDSSGGRFFSRSAPEHLGVHDDQKPRASSSAPISDPHSHPTKVAPSTKLNRERGHYVTILDLAPLRHQHQVSQVDEILVSISQPAAKLEFSADGTSIGVALRDGHSATVFKLRPLPHIRTSSLRDGEEGREAEHERSTATRVYDLHRGVTSAVIESIFWAKDGRYVGMGTMNRTAHIYAVNPYGGKPDLRSHLNGQIRNVETVALSTTALTSIAKLRGSRKSHPESQAALALTFVSDAELLVAPHLLPPSSPNRRTRSPPLSPLGGRQSTNSQHVLLFDPEDGVLSLHRLTLEKTPSRDPIIGGVAASIQALGVTSMSFPGTSNPGRLSTSPSAKPVVTAKPTEALMELGAKVNQVATYNLKRGKDWDEVIKALESGPGKQSSPGGDWLAEAELSTCSSSQQIIPRSIYLSHQFSFHTLGEDYHALIRSYQLHVSGSKIDVRKEVEVRTSAWNIATFSEGFSSALDSQRDPSSSFDEPILSAISGSFDNSNIPRILPMYPNGLPGANVKSLRNSIPIRAISGLGDGVSESFGRIRNRVRSPRGVAPRSDVGTTSVPLEFDEGEEFLDQHGETSRDGGANIIPTSSSHKTLSSTRKLLDADIVGTVDEELYDGWDVEDKQAIDEVEQFQDIGVVASYLVEEEPEEHRRRDKRNSKKR